MPRKLDAVPRMREDGGATMKGATRMLLLAGVTCFRTSSSAWGADPVPGAMEKMAPYPRLSDAVTRAVFESPRGSIHGHDAERIDVTVNDEAGTAEIRFIMPPAFELHGDRSFECVRKKAEWTCREAE